MEELRDLLDLEISSKDIHIREDENGNTGVLLQYGNLRLTKLGGGGGGWYS